MNDKTPNNPNPPAFPFGLDHAHATHIASGMSLRDYFAAKAMTVLLRQALELKESDSWDNDIRHASVDCYIVADVMLTAREKTGGGA